MLFRSQKFFVSYYYVFIILSSLLLMIGIRGGMTITYWLSIMLAATVIFDIKYNVIDLLVLFFALYSISTYFMFGDYPQDIFIRTFRDQITPMSLYFFARSRKTRNCDFIKNMIYSMTIVYLIGFILFFFPPSWYLEYKLQGAEIKSDHIFFELTRMSAFWTASYFVGYSSLFVLMYIIIKRLRGEQMKYYKYILCISLLSLFFAQQRVSIAFLILFLLILLFDNLRKRKIKAKSLVRYTVLTFGIILFLLVLVYNLMDNEYIEYLLNRSVNQEGNMVDDRIEMFSKHIETITFWGSGLGRYSHNAIEFGYECISDCEYIRTPNELGIFGTSLFLFIVGLNIFKSWLNNKCLVTFEIMVVCFYLVAMIGATPLEGPGQQPYMMWYCLGKMQFR